MGTKRGLLEQIEETKEAIQQRARLRRIKDFLIDADADEELLLAIDIAIDDIERWISPEIELTLGDETASRLTS